MQVYLLTIFAVLVCGLIDSRTNRTGRFLFWRWAILAILVCVSGLRYQVGADYGAYAGGYMDYATEDLNGWANFMQEPGIRILARLVHWTYDDYAAFIFCSSLITIGLYIYTLSKVNQTFWLGVMLFIMIGSWAVSFNAVRQCLAAAILFAGHRYIYRRNLWKWCLVVFCAMMFHVSALYCILLYLVKPKQIKGAGLAILVIVAISGGLLSDYLFSLNEAVKDKEISDVGMVYATRSVNILRIIVCWIPALCYLFFLRKKTTEDSRFSFYMNMILVNALISSVTKNSALFFRMSIYTQIFMAIGWPMIIDRLPKPSRSFYTALLLIAYFCWFIMEIYPSSDFNWIFNRQYSGYY